jgi:hypothetical protein
MVRAGAGKLPTIVGKGGWGEGTYNAQMSERGQKKGEYASYLKRSVENLNDASLNRTQVGAYAEPAPNPFVAVHHREGAPRMTMGHHVPQALVIPPKPTTPPPHPPQPVAAASTNSVIQTGNTRKLIEKFGGGV